MARRDDDFSLSDSGETGSVGSQIGSEQGGNPGGNGNVGNAVDPAAARTENDTERYTGTLNKDGSPRKKRGPRPKKADNPQDLEADIEGTASLLLAIHTILAVNVPEMEMSEEEATQVAKAFARVERHYPTVQKILTSKIKDHVGFFAVVGRVYGSRIAAIRVRKAAENARDITPETAQSTATPGPGHPLYRPS